MPSTWGCNISVNNGQRADEETFNDAFLSRTTDSDTVAVVGLNNPGSGGLISNTQQKINNNTTAASDNASDIAILQSDKENKSEKGVANGYVPLDGSAKIDPIYLDTSLLNLKGNWDASTNTPTLVDGVGDPGDFYIVNVAGTQDLGSGPITFDIGDWCFYNDSNVWIKVINSNTVTSVNGQTGVVSLALNDITDINIPSPGPSDDQKAVIYDDASGEYILGQPVGAGGSGGINYVINSDAELTADNHVPYKDAAQDTPVDGDGGSPLITISRTTITTDILRGVGSFAISRPAANVQGEGVHVELDPIDSADRYSRQQVSFDLKCPVPGSNNYADGDLRAFIYDVDNAVLLGPVENDDDGDLLRIEAEQGGTFVGFFNATDSLNYRLLLHFTTTTATSAIMVYDNVKLGPIGLVSTVNTQEELIDVTGSGAFTGGSIRASRVGGVVSLTVVTPITHASLGFALSGVGIIPDWAAPNQQAYNTYEVGGANVIKSIGVLANGSFWFEYRDYTGSTTAQTTSGAGGTVSYPVEHSDNLISATKLTQQTTIVNGVGNGSTVLTANVTDIDFTEVIDNQSAWSGTGFTAPKNGTYKAAGFVRITAGTTLVITAYNDGVAGRIAGFNGGDAVQSHLFQWEGYLEQGEVLSFRSSAGVTLDNSVANSHWISISSVPDLTTYGVTTTNRDSVEASSAITNYTIPASTWGDLTSIVLPSGTWDITSVVYFYNNGGVTAGTVQCGVSTNSGTSGAGLVLGDNSGATNIAATSTLHTVLPIPTYTVNHSVDTTYYLKSFKAAAITNQQVYYKIHARRV